MVSWLIQFHVSLGTSRYHWFARRLMEVFLIMTAVWAVACSTEDSHPREAGESSARQQKDEVSTTPSSSLDSVRLAAYLNASRYELDRIMDQRSRHFAVLASSQQNNTDLFLLLVTDTTVFLLAEPEPISQYGPFWPESGEWHSTSSSDVDTFIYSWNLAVEMLIGSTVYVKEDSRFAVAFRDGAGTCKPSQLRDVDNDGLRELVTYADTLSDITQGWACRTPACLDPLETDFDIVPAWYGIRRRTGNSWDVQDRGYREFYVHLSERYERAASWIAGLSDDNRCKRYGLESHLRVWAAQARGRASGS